MRQGLEKAGFGKAVKIISSMSDDALEATAVYYTDHLRAAAGIAVPQSAQEEVRNVLYALAGRPPSKRMRVKGPRTPMITAEERARILQGEPGLTYIDDVWKDPRALPQGWWIGSSQLERVDGSLEVSGHEVPIESIDAPPAERQNLFTGRRIVKLWSVGDRKVDVPPQGRQPTEAPRAPCRLERQSRAR